MQMRRASYYVQGERLLPVHVRKQNGGQQIKSQDFPVRDIKNKRRVTALSFAILDKFPANAIT